MLLLVCHLARQEGACFQEMKTNMDDPASFNDSLCAPNPSTLLWPLSEFQQPVLVTAVVHKIKASLKAKGCWSTKHTGSICCSISFPTLGNKNKKQIQRLLMQAGWICFSIPFQIVNTRLGLGFVGLVGTLSKLSRPGKGLG